MGSKLRILLVDDEERILRSLGLLLRMQYEVITTTKGSEALILLKEQEFHVLISDQRMPEMTGTEVLRQAREISPHTIRILLTGYADAEASLASINEGEVFRYINKPWGPKELRDTVGLAAELAKQSRDKLNSALPAHKKAVTSPIRNLLVLDPDAQTADMVKEIVGAQHHVIWAATLEAALRELATQNITVLVTELLLPGEDAGTLIKTLKRERPQILTIVLTSLKDTRRVVELINQAQVFRYLPKPARRGLLGKSLETTLARLTTLEQAPADMPEMPVEPIPEIREQLLSSRLASHLQRLRARMLSHATVRT